MEIGVKRSEGDVFGAAGASGASMHMLTGCAVRRNLAEVDDHDVDCAQLSRTSIQRKTHVSIVPRCPYFSEYAERITSVVSL